MYRAGFRLAYSSAACIEGLTPDPHCVLQVTVAVVRYDALGKDRVGVTSTLLAERLQVMRLLPASCHQRIAKEQTMVSAATPVMSDDHKSHQRDFAVSHLV